MSDFKVVIIKKTQKKYIKLYDKYNLIIIYLNTFGFFIYLLIL